MQVNGVNLETVDEGTGVPVEGVKTTEEFIARHFRAFPPAERAWALEENLKFPRHHAARLVVDHCTQDWRDVVPRINIPTLVVGGWANAKSQEWIGANNPKARVEIFDAPQAAATSCSWRTR